jgi:hypothetical protein
MGDIHKYGRQKLEETYTRMGDIKIRGDIYKYGRKNYSRHTQVWEANIGGDMYKNGRHAQ